MQYNLISMIMCDMLQLFANVGLSACALINIYRYLLGVTSSRLLSHCRGDLKAIERVAYEMAEDQAQEGILYTEVRLTPRDLLPNLTKTSDKENKDGEWTSEFECERDKRRKKGKIRKRMKENMNE